MFIKIPKALFGHKQFSSQIHFPLTETQSTAGCEYLYPFTKTPQFTAGMEGGMVSGYDIRIPCGLPQGSSSGEGLITRPAEVRELLAHMRTLITNDKYYRMTFLLPYGVREIFTQELEKTLATSSLSELISALKDQDEHIRVSAASLLSLIPHEAKSAVPALFSNLWDENDYVRRSAAMALGKIGVENYIPAYHPKPAIEN